MSKGAFHKGVHGAIMSALNKINELRFSKVVQNGAYLYYEQFLKVSL
jgi:hypothetical protein